MINYGSVCSGIEAASVAWSPLGWQASWLAEIEPFPSSVLQHHYPDTPNHGDMTLLPDMVLGGEIDAPDVLVGGTPCQSFSVAGMRAGLSDDRGQLTIKFVELADAIDNIRRSSNRPESIIVWENVPGVLSSKDNAFGCFLAALAGEDEELHPAGGGWSNAGYILGPKRAIAWRILDAQYFGVAQRRRRVFVVASSRDGFCPAKVLFEFDGVRRDSAPCREAGQDLTSDVGTGFTASSFGGYRKGVGTLRAAGGDLGGGSETLVSGFRKLTFESYAQDETSSTMMARDYKSHTDLVAFNSRQDPISGEVFGALDTCSPQAQAIAIQNQSKNQNNCLTPDQPQVWRVYDPNGVSPTLQSGEARGNIIADQHRQSNITPYSVRRLTPIECERLQGFPDSYTKIPWRNKPHEQCPDGHRYKALGNSMAVPVMAWIGKRINKEISK